MFWNKIKKSKSSRIRPNESWFDHKVNFHSFEMVLNKFCCLIHIKFRRHFPAYMPKGKANTLNVPEYPCEPFISLTVLATALKWVKNKWISKLSSKWRNTWTFVICENMCYNCYDLMGNSSSTNKFLLCMSSWGHMSGAITGTVINYNTLVWFHKYE